MFHIFSWHQSFYAILQSICNFQIIFHFQVGIIELWVQKVTCSMQGAMKLACPSIINDCKYIFVFTFIVIEWLHYYFLDFLHCFIYIAHKWFSFLSTRQRTWTIGVITLRANTTWFQNEDTRTIFIASFLLASLDNLLLLYSSEVNIFLKFPFSWCNLYNDK